MILIVLWLLESCLQLPFSYHLRNSNELRRDWWSAVDGKLPALLPQRHLILLTIAVNWWCCCWWCGCCKAAYHLRNSNELRSYWWSSVDGKLPALLPQHHLILLTIADNSRCCWCCGCCKAAYHLRHSNKLRHYWWSAVDGKLPALLPQHHLLMLLTITVNWRCCCWWCGCWSAACPPPSTPPDSALPFLSSTPPQGTGFDALLTQSVLWNAPNEVPLIPQGDDRLPPFRLVQIFFQLLYMSLAAIQDRW